MKLWGGRFQKNSDKLMEDFHSSIAFDQRLYLHDIEGSIAHAEMLGEEGIITAAEAKRIVEGLRAILAEVESGQVSFTVGAEDIHMNIETLLIEKIGEVGKKLHTGRSRNDQVALDTRLFMKAEIKETQRLLARLLTVLADMAEAHAATIMPGFTHLQTAQPVTLGHHLLAYAQMFKRDQERLADCLARTDVMPLGAGALAGTTYPLNRESVAKKLGFARVTENSLDSVSDRDYVIEFLAAASLVMMHLSRFCEEIILWASQQFAFVELDDAYSTGSSMMPQKKNPDVAELVRGKTGRVYGDLLGVLTMMKGLPLAYNKDMQEDKEALFDGVDTVQKCLMIFTPMLSTLTFSKEKMRDAAGRGFSNATDLADHLVGKGLSFRDAHHVVGQLVSYGLACGRALEELELEELQRGLEVLGQTGSGQKDYGQKGFFQLDESVYEALKLDTVVSRRTTYGGTAPECVLQAAARLRQYLEKLDK